MDFQRRKLISFEIFSPLWKAITLAIPSLAFRPQNTGNEILKFVSYKIIHKVI